MAFESTEEIIAKPTYSPQSSLNSEQLRAVQHFTGPLLVLAGAGSGKTRVLTHRVANLILGHQVDPRQILAVTFTNKATNEMRERLRSLLGEKADRLWAATFHSAALRILRQHAHLLSYSNSFVVYDDQDSLSLIKQVLKELGLKDKRHSPGLYSRLIDEAKNAYILPEEYATFRKRSNQGDFAAEVYQLYQKALKHNNAMDFGDLLLNTVYLFQSFPHVLAFYQNSLRFILIDEYQDTNKVQYLLVSALAAKHNNIFVVGDDDQSIYSFRGANIQNILNFEKDFPGTAVIKLEQNYRSTSNILTVGHAVIEKNISRKGKRLWTDQPPGDLVCTYVGEDELDEGEFVAKAIAQRHQEGLPLQNVAVFYRTNAQSRALEEALIKERLPYRIFGGLKFYERKEIKDVLAYLRLLINPADEQAFLRSVNNPPRGIGAKTIGAIQEKARRRGGALLETAREVAESNQHVATFIELVETLRSAANSLGFAELMRKTIELSGYDVMLKTSKEEVANSRLDNLRELVAIAQSLELGEQDTLEQLAQFLDRVSLTSSSDLALDSSDKGSHLATSNEYVSLMTLHLAKGLEFDVVFLTGLEEGLLPHHRCLNNPQEIEEERRLCYVGITRARKKLFITRCMLRGMFMGGDGLSFGGMFRDASRFAYDMPQECLEHAGREFAQNRIMLGDDNIDPDLEFEHADRESPIEQKPVRIVRRRAGLAQVRSADELLENE